jgi:polyisoprenyl-phosphate glycosyltransferase
MNKPVKISVVIPVYNSSTTIEKLTERLIGMYAQKYSLQIILVNDGSNDESEIICKKLAEKRPEVCFINLSRNFGQHNATLAGLNYATGEYVATMDDDLQHPPEELQKLIDKILEGKDIVYGEFIHKHHGTLKNIGSKINNLMAWGMIGKPWSFDLTSFRIMRPFIVKEILKYDAPFPYLDGIIMRTTRNIGLAKVRHDSRPHGKSNYTFRKLIGLWFNGFFNYSILPLRISTWVGFIMALFGFIFSIMQVINQILNPQAIMGWTSLITSVMIFSGVQLMAMGVIGEYIGRIFLTQNRTPAFVIKELLKNRE